MLHSHDLTTFPAQVRLYLLGPFRLERQTQPIHLPTRKAEALLAFLVLHPGPHSREKLATLLWGDSTDEQARRSLRTALASVRKELGDVLLSDRETMQCNPDHPIWVDVHIFEQAISPDPQTAIVLYQDHLLAGFYDDWVLQERQRLHVLYVDALLRLAQQARSEGRYRSAIDLAQKALDRDPANEKAYQHIIFCLAATGDRTGALKRYEECEKALHEELGVAPSQETILLRNRIQQELTGSKSREALFTNLPYPLTSFIGREKEITEVKRLIEQYRLVTLTGPGGCGKTRLAIEVARERVDLFQNGVWWVDLAPLSDSSLVPERVAQVLGMREQANQSLELLLVTFLRDRQLLLILDNCEHLISACADLVAKLLTACSELRVLTTSRESLGITGEMAWSVPSLSIPEAPHLLPVEELTQYDAMLLFAERAASIQPRWKTIDHALAVAHVCRRLDGIPLAIELAAARMKVLSVEEIAMRLNNRFNLLTDGSRTALPRQQTLRATIDWSYDLLSDAERMLLCRVSVFAGGWSLPAAVAVCEAPNTLDLLTRLVDKSLVVAGQRDGSTRYTMLETIRQYALEKLIQTEEKERIQAQHFTFFLQLAETVGPNVWDDQRQKESLDILDLEHDNLRAALGWSLKNKPEIGIRLAGALGRFWQSRGYLWEGYEWLAQFLDLNETSTPSAPRALALTRAGWHARTLRKYLQAAEWLQESLAIYRKLDDQRGIASALVELGWLAQKRADWPSARVLFAQSLEIYRAVHDPHGISRALHDLGSVQESLEQARLLIEEGLCVAEDSGLRVMVGICRGGLGEIARFRGEFSLARTLYEENLAIMREFGLKTNISWSLGRLADVAIHQHDYDSAQSFIEESLSIENDFGDRSRLARVYGNQAALACNKGHFKRARELYRKAILLAKDSSKLGIALVLEGLADVAFREGKLEHAAVQLAAAAAIRSEMDMPAPPFTRTVYDHILATARAALDEATFNSAWKKGQQMTTEQSVEYALGRESG